MKRYLQYGLIIFSFTCLAASCNRRKKLDERISLWRMDRIPYGTRYAYDNLAALFPEAIIRTGSNFPVLFPEESMQDTLRALIVLTPAFIPEPEEVKSLIRFASSGNQVFISANFIADTVLEMLHLKSLRSLSIHVDDPDADSTTQVKPGEVSAPLKKSDVPTPTPAAISLLDPLRKEWIPYTYPGAFFENYFDSLDTRYCKILGRNENGRPNFIRISYGHSGAIYVHLEPMAFSNFFLLHKENSSYYDLALSWLPEKTGVVEWSDYFRYSHQGQSYSPLRFILSNRALRWAFWLTLMLFLLIFLVESKRKQRAIAEIPKLRNASEDFVKTVGRLYFQQKNNQNLAVKMTNTFLENVRSAYNIPTSSLDDEFVRKLAFRTGKHYNEIADLIQDIHNSRLKVNLTDREILDLHSKINQFNKPAT